MASLLAIALCAATVTPSTAEASPAQAPLEQIRADYDAAAAKLAPHLIDDEYLDEDPHAADYLAAVWTTSQRWLTAWLNAHPDAQAQDVTAAVKSLNPDVFEPACLRLADDALLIRGPSFIANVFIAAKRNGRFEVAWDIAQSQDTSALKDPGVIAGWRADASLAGTNDGGSLRGVEFGMLSRDSNNRPRFYIDAGYAGNGYILGDQTSVWRWDGTTAKALAARHYAVSTNMTVGLRVEGQDLKIREVRWFRSLLTFGGDESGQDWVVRLTPGTVEDLGEIVVMPELDVVDDLFDRVIHGRPAAAIASAAAVRNAGRIVREGRSLFSEPSYRPQLIFASTEQAGKNRTLCMGLDPAGIVVATLEPSNGTFYIRELRELETRKCP